MSIEPTPRAAAPEDALRQHPPASEANVSRPPLRLDSNIRAKETKAAAIVEWALIAASYAVLFFEYHWVGSDGAMRFDALSQLLATGKMPTVKLSLVGPLFSVPLWYIGKKWLGDPRLGCAYYNWIVLGIGVAVFARSLRGLLAPAAVRRFLLLLVAGSMFTFHVQAYYGEVFTAILVGVGILSVCAKRGAWLGWTAIVLGAVNTPAAGLAAGMVCLFFVLENRRIRYVIPVIAVGALSVVESILHRGGGLKSGYEGAAGLKTIMPYSGIPNFSYPIFLGLLSLVFSIGKGILFYAPGVFAPVKTLLQDKPQLLKTYRVWLVFLVGLMVVYAKWWAWQGGEFWGPRYVMFASIPASFALAINLRERRTIAHSLMTLAMLTLSVWIGADGTLFGQQNEGICSANAYALEHLCWYVPEFAAWIRPFIVSRALTATDWIFISVYVAVYVYLAAPQVAFLTRAMTSRVRGPIVRALDWRAWKV
jgi:hypothetical protein